MDVTRFGLRCCFVISLVFPTVHLASSGSFEEGQAKLLAGDPARALILYLEAAQQGHTGAQYNVGILYATGDGVPRDYNEALRWLTRAANQGMSRAQSALANMYFNGLGTDRNVVKSYMWQSLAADQMLPQAIGKMSETRKQMSASQIAEAEKMKREWKPKIEKAANER